jgi:hypothetical protein
LDDAEGVDPEIAETETASDDDGVPNSGRDRGQRQALVRVVLKIGAGQSDWLRQSPAITEGKVLAKTLGSLLVRDI